MKFTVTLVIAAATAATVALAGCSSSASSSSKTSAAAALSGPITVFAASSLTGTFTALGASFEKAHPGTTVKFSFASSGALATQIDQAAPADVFASASPDDMQTVVKAGNAAPSVDFVKNTAEIATPPGNPKNITSVADLAKSGVKVALCIPTAPCGELALAIFKNAGVTVKPTASEPDVKATLAIVETKEVDAGVVYVTDVLAAKDKVTGVPIPAAHNAITAYPIAALTHSKNPAEASAFVTYVESPAALAVLEAAGFLAP